MNIFRFLAILFNLSKKVRLEPPATLYEIDNKAATLLFVGSADNVTLNYYTPPLDLQKHQNLGG